MKKLFVVLIFFFSGIPLMIPPGVQAGWILVTHDNYPPYNFVDETGTPAGLDTELVLAVMDYLGQGYDIKFVPWKRVVQMTEKYTADIAFQFKPTEERREKYLLVGPLRTGKTVFAVRKDSPLSKFETLADLTPYTIGVNLGYSYGDEFDNADYLKKDTGAKTNAQLIKKLIRKRADVIIGDQCTLAYAARKQAIYEQIRILSIYREFPRYVAVHREKAGIAGLFDHGLNAIRDNGVYDRIIEKWQ
ncbi:MAG: transporter substrate-binding domain-containing protein [Desulfobacterales bacterium]|nr:transporter substrate-binding domain-containing protein [Desulfobacterales bacterium]